MTSYPAPTGYAPSYSWIGAPTAFNGTNPLSGGDSCGSTSHSSYIICHNHPSPPSGSDFGTTEIANKCSSRGKSQSMVCPWRPSVHYCRFGHGGRYDTRPRISVLGAGKEEIRSDHALGYYGLLLRHHIPMVLLGLFPSIFGTRNKRLYWRSEALWFDQHAWCSESWVAIDSRVAV